MKHIITSIILLNCYLLHAQAPIMAITAANSSGTAVSDGDSTSDATLSLTFTSSEATTDFTLGDITVSGGTISNFSATSSTVYTATLTPSGNGTHIIGINDGSFTDASGNSNNQFSITQTSGTHGGGGSSHYQTFTATGDMPLDFIQVKHGYPHNSEERTVYLNLYQGSGTSGMLLGTSNNGNTGTTSTSSSYNTYYFSGQGIALTSGQVYTWEIYFSGTQTTGWISFANNNPYDGGYGYYCCDDFTNDDFLFKIQSDDIFAWTAIQDTTVPTMAITAANSSGTAVSDGSTTSDPTLILTFTSSEATTDFTVGDITVSGGTISNFSATSSTVYTATLTPSGNGTHIIGINDGSFTDASGNSNNQFSITQTSGTHGGGGSSHYQTFTATGDMPLDFIQVKHGYPHNSEERTVYLNLYQGSGTSGMLLGTSNNGNTGTTSTSSSYNTYYFSGQGIALTSGQVYTWEIYFSGTQTTGWISFANNNPYDGGYGYYCCDDFTNDDFLFKIQSDDIFAWTHIDLLSIIDIWDVPNDQGSWVYIQFIKSVHDVGDEGPLGLYNIERLDDEEWVSLHSIVAYGAEYYTTEAHTLMDSTEDDDGMTTYRVVVAMDDVGVSISETAVGYSVDNIAPSVPGGLMATALDEGIHLTWDVNVEEDFQYFILEKSLNSEFQNYQTYELVAKNGFFHSFHIGYLF